jgi:uncharacterized membrane protein YhaH (DUF805 family)
MTALTTEVRDVQLTEQEIWFGYKGRITAGQYWGRFALMWIGTFILGMALASTSDETAGLATVAVLVVGVWIGSALAWKRLQDQGRSGAMFFLVLIPLAGPIIWIVLSLLGGSAGANQYGPRSGYRYR